MALGKRLKQARERRGWTQEQLAVAAGMPPDGRATVQAVESRDSQRTKYAGAFAKALGIRLPWLQDGEEPMESQAGGRNDSSSASVKSASDNHSQDKENVRPLGTRQSQKLPLISWKVAGMMERADEIAAVEEPLEWMESPYGQSGPHAFLLAVEGDSMLSQDGTGYAHGDVIQVEPALDAVHNDDVVVRLADGTAMFRRFKMGPEGAHLEAINPSWPGRISRMPADAVVLGVVIGKWSRKRR